MKITIYLEGGGDSKELHTRCREGFRRLFERCGFTGKMPKLVACGGRGQAYDDFCTGHRSSSQGHLTMMLVDSEDPMADIEATWTHLKDRDGWDKPNTADDEQVLMMTTCMETWIVADREALKSHYGYKFQESGLPNIVGLESKHRHAVQNSLVHATRNCKNKYEKGKRSFQVLARLTPNALSAHAPSFARTKRILGAKL